MWFTGGVDFAVLGTPGFGFLAEGPGCESFFLGDAVDLADGFTVGLVDKGWSPGGYGGLFGGDFLGRLSSSI